MNIRVAKEPIEILLLTVILVAYAEEKEVIGTDNKLVHYPKNIPSLSSSRTHSALSFRGFLGVLR